MGSIIKIQLFNDRFTFLELKNDEKIEGTYHRQFGKVMLMGENMIIFVK